MTATRNKTLADLEKHFQIQMKNFEEKLKSFQEPAASVSTAGADTIESLKLEFKVFKSEITKKLENIMNEISQKNLSKMSLFTASMKIRTKIFLKLSLICSRITLT